MSIEARWLKFAEQDLPEKRDRLGLSFQHTDNVRMCPNPKCAELREQVENERSFVCIGLTAALCVGMVIGLCLALAAHWGWGAALGLMVD